MAIQREIWQAGKIGKFRNVSASFELALEGQLLMIAQAEPDSDLPDGFPSILLPKSAFRVRSLTTKNEEPRAVKMTEEVYQLLSMAVSGKGPLDHVFTRADKPVRDFRQMWNNLTEAAKLPGLLLHDFRRSAVRNLIRRGVPQVVAMKISGHKTMAVFNRYNIVDESDLADAAKRIENGRENSLSTAQVAATASGNPKAEQRLLN